MTFNLSPHTRVVALVGVAALVAMAALVALRTGIVGGSPSEISAPRTTPATKPVPSAKPATPAPARPKVELLPGLPQPVARALRRSRVVVVSLHSGSAPGDRPAIAEARSGARSAGAGFVAVNVVNNRRAGELTSFVGPVSAPAMLVVRRPGKIVTRMVGLVDTAVVMQAAHNAGARRR